MQKDTLNSNHIIKFIILIISSSSIITGAFSLGQDFWLSVVLAFIFFIPMMLIYSRILFLMPGKGLFNMFDTLFGKGLTFILTLIVCFYSLFAGSYILRVYVDYTSVISLQDTPLVPINILIIITAVYLAYKGFSVFGKWVSVATTLIATTVIISFFAAFNVMDFTSILPIFDHPISQIAENSLVLYSIPFGELIYILLIFDHVKIKEKKSTYKIFITGTILGTLLLLLIVLRNLCILGPGMIVSAKYASYQASRIIHLGSFLERVESIISFNLLLFGITKLAFFISITSKGISKLMKLDSYKSLIVPISLICMTISSIILKTTYEILDFYWIYKYLVFPIQFIIPLLVWITAEIKNRKTKKIVSA